MPAVGVRWVPRSPDDYGRACWRAFGTATELPRLMRGWFEQIGMTQEIEQTKKLDFPDGMLEDIELISNPPPLRPCVLLLDVSYSMAGDQINELNEGLKIFADELSKDSLASIRTEVAVITFGDEAKVVRPFAFASDFDPPHLEVEQSTNLGEGIELALDEIERRKKKYRAVSVEYYSPWLFVITDGAPTDDVSAVSNRLHQAVKQEAIWTFVIGLRGADMDELRKIFRCEPMMLKGSAFSEMFQWMSASLLCRPILDEGGANFHFERIQLPYGDNWADNWADGHEKRTRTIFYDIDPVPVDADTAFGKDGWATTGWATKIFRRLHERFTASLRNR